ncbi:hypothetical protein GCM10011390_51060 [Aureimonas endophytica]|uniref:Diguanylate cyclase/phosphodiesterase n=2 Tax=Aureimonas endophytica TaxID=2027858 RepID=A0A917EDK9_9HYPH|nr:hypothetical protein GCM10011390_51060 [Aureimonas endophytica]
MLVGPHSLLLMQNEILEAIALDRELPAVAEMLCRQVETLTEGAICSILAVDREGLLHPLAAPSLPAGYAVALNGFAIGPWAGSSGTAAFRGEDVVVVDIETDPLWADHQAIARDFGVRASWSTPVKTEDGRVLGTLSLYYREARAPSEAERGLVAACVNLCLIAFRHHEAQAHIERLAYTDILTNLPNRLAFELRASEMLEGDEPLTTAIHYIDLDDFKSVNDTLGHWFGDLLLAEVGRRLRQLATTRDCVARLGGDEFAVCAGGRDDAAQAGFADDLLKLFAEPFAIAGRSLMIEASIGTAIAPRNGLELAQLLQQADIALYEAKSSGRHTARVFSDEMADGVRRRNTIKGDLATAFASGQFHVVYQPIVDLRANRIVAFETLLRWTHPEKGAVPPDLFVPIAEETGLMREIGLWVLHQALADLATWPADLMVAVNVSPLQLKYPSFALDVASALARVGLPPRRLTLEITETALLDGDTTTQRSLGDLKTLGVGIALDDFGTGYSSLSNLRDRRFGKMKIDKSFVDGIGRDTVCEAIVDGTIEFARKLGKRVTAEGIETEIQRAWLVAHGCDKGQGYLFSRPMTRERVLPFVATVGRGEGAAPSPDVLFRRIG